MSQALVTGGSGFLGSHIADVWKGERMSEIRNAHSRGAAHTVAICDGCVLRACEVRRLAT